MSPTTHVCEVVGGEWHCFPRRPQLFTMMGTGQYVKSDQNYSVHLTQSYLKSNFFSMSFFSVKIFYPYLYSMADVHETYVCPLQACRNLTLYFKVMTALQKLAYQPFFL